MASEYFRSRARPALWFLSLVMVSLFTGAFIAWSWVRPVALNAVEWRREAKGPDYRGRYRMSGDLLRRAKAEQWNLQRTIELLGQPENANGIAGEFDHGPAMLAYRVGAPPLSMPHKTYKVVFAFDSNGRFLWARLVPE